MPLVACRPAQALILSGFNHLPLRCFVPAAPAPLLLHRRLHLPIRTSAYFNYPLRSEHSRCLFLFPSASPRHGCGRCRSCGVTRRRLDEATAGFAVETRGDRNYGQRLEAWGGFVNTMPKARRDTQGRGIHRRYGL
ncbi:uncharacterized protein LOC122005027 isoform X2 [Zingiber officinale]|uniref:uncharacterized protein LOC122005027 isoform X2 n=1 Tax=Zingiber officinale TaxID=94328 RepID=UPI001C4D39B2|nr:uncharacterized protein LOC122005027 isoform X2 [Zingiber officinale]